MAFTKLCTTDETTAEFLFIKHSLEAFLFVKKSENTDIPTLGITFQQSKREECNFSSILKMQMEVQGLA